MSPIMSPIVGMLRTLALGALFTAALITPSLAHAQQRLTPFSEPAVGETYHVEGGLDFWNPSPDLTVASERFGLAGTQINAITDLGIQRKELTQLRLVARPARKHRFRVDYMPMHYEAQTSAHREFVFNGIRYSLNLPVTTDLTWRTWLLGYEYDAFYRDRGFIGFVAQAKVTHVQVDLNSPIGSDFAEARAPIPNLGGIGRIYVTPNISITGELVGIKLPESINKDYHAHYIDFDLYGTVNFNNYVGAQFGFRSLDLGYIIKKDTGTFKMRGLYFGGVARY
jgi:hypothetical protein